MRIIIKIFIYLILILIGLVFGLLLITKTQWFKDKVVIFTETRLENVFYGRVEIGKLEGSLFKSISLKDLAYIDSTGKKIISIEELGVTYRIRELLSKSIYADDFHITKSEVHLVKSDSIWNISTIIKPANKKKEKKPFMWKIKVDNADLNELEVFVTTANSSLPESLKTSINFNFQLISQKILVNLNSLQLVTRSPDLLIKEGHVFFEKDGSLLRIKDLRLNSDSSFISMNGFLSSKNFEKGKLDLTSKIAFQELRPFVKGLNNKASPEIEIQALLENGDMDAEISIKEKEQSVAGRVQLMGLLREISLKTKLGFNHINISTWLDKDELKSDLSGGLDIESNSLEFKSGNIKGDFFLANTPVRGIELDSLHVWFDKKGDAIQSELMLQSGKSKGDFSVGISELYAEPEYKIIGELRQLNIGKILNNKKLITDINMKIALSGSGKTPETASFALNTEIDKAVYADFKIENTIIKLQYDKGNYDIYDFRLHSSVADLVLTGQGSLKDSTNLDLEMYVKDLSSLKHLLKQKEIKTNGLVKANISGNIDSLVSNIRFDLSGTMMDTISIDELSGELAVNIFPKRKQYSGNSKIKADKLQYGKYKLEKLILKSEFSEKQYDNLIHFESKDSLDGDIDIDINVESDPLFALNKIDLNIYGHNWVGGSDSSEVQLFKGRIAVRNIDIESEDQIIFINGYYSFKGKEDLKMDIKNVRIDKLPFIGKVPGQPTGVLNFDLDLQGSASQPKITGGLMITNGSMSDISIDTLSLDLNYASNNLDFTGSLMANNTHLVTVSAEVPYHLSFTDSIQKIDKNIPVKLSLKTDSLDLNFISSILDNDKFIMSGTLIGDFKVDGSVADPLFTGFLNLNNGSFQFKKLGIYYHDVVLKSGFRENKYVLDSLRILSGKKGELNVTGEAVLGSTFKKPIDRFSVNITGSDFVLAKSRLAEIEFNTNLNLKGTMDDPQFKGSLDIGKARINMDELMRRSGRKPKKIGTPMLVKAINDTLIELVENDTISFTIDSTKFQHQKFLKNLHGDLSVDLPGNVWIRGNDMNIQLEGKLKVTKNKWDVRYFGDVEVKRGYYKLYGRKLVIDKASIKLRGEEEIDPVLNVHVYYKFRVRNNSGNDNLKILNIKVSGTLKEPLLNFDLDGKGIEKEDAISYLLFGMKIDDLDFSQQSQMPGSGEDLAKDIGFSQLANMLQSTIGQSIGLDVIEIDSEDNWDTAPITLGKYITNYLYMSYTYTFSLTNEKKDYEPYKLVLEYQVLRNLFLQGSNSGSDSGFDVFLRFDF